MTVNDCGRKHLTLVLAIAGTVAAIMLTIAGTLWNSQAAACEKLDVRIRAAEQQGVRVATELEQMNKTLARIERGIEVKKP